VRAVASARYLHGVDIEMSGMMWLGDGRVGSFHCGFNSPLRQSLEIAGTEGVIYVPDMWLPANRATWTVYREGRPNEEHFVEGENQIQHMLEDFGRAALAGEALRPDPMEAVKTLRVLDALAASAKGEKAAVVSVAAD
jgi:D-xylose 1-dehydrogenase (NADP+, D-xylono-1,5-lactone-forming)